LRLYVHGQGQAFTVDSNALPNVLYRVEKSRGYDSQGNLWSPGYFRANLSRADTPMMISATEVKPSGPF
jgi:hypothetical protein